LKLFCKKALLVFDADEAGIAAARRSLSFLAESDFRPKVLLLPQGEDPDSFLRKNGSHAFNKMISGSMTMIEFLLKNFRGDKSDQVREALGIISSMKDTILADETLGELSDRSRINETVLRNELDKIRKTPLKDSRTAGAAKPSRRKAHREEYILLSTLLACPEKAPVILSGLNIDAIQNELIKSIFKKMKALSDNLSVNSLLDKAEEAERFLITELSCNPGFDLEHVDRNIHDCLRIIKQRRLEEQQRLAEEKGDIALLDSLLKEKRRFIKADI
jgi:DNA primase